MPAWPFRGANSITKDELEVAAELLSLLSRMLEQQMQIQGSASERQRALSALVRIG
jgi:hypothetical protein